MLWQGEKLIICRGERMDEILNKSVVENIEENYEKLFSAERKVIDVVLKRPQDVVNMNVSELARESEVSDATVVRVCHRIGYKGYYQFRLMLARDVGREQVSQSEVPEQACGVMSLFQEYAKVMMTIGQNMDEQVMRRCVELIKNCKQAHILAVGNTAPLAQYMGFRLGRLGIKSTSNMSPEYFMNHVNLADERDIVIAISQSGASKAVVQGVELGIEKGLEAIAITAHRFSPLEKAANYVLLSRGVKESFGSYKNYAYLKEMAVIDALLDFVTSQERLGTICADKAEVILSETKM